MRNLLPIPLLALLISGCGAKADDSAAAPSNAATPAAPVAAKPAAPPMSPPAAANPDASAGGTAVNANELGPQ